MMNNIQIEILVKREKEQIDMLSLAIEQSPNKRKKIALDLKEEQGIVQTIIEDSLDEAEEEDDKKDKAVNYFTISAVNEIIYIV